MQVKRPLSAFRCLQPPAPVASCFDQGDLPLSKPLKRAILASKRAEIWRMPVDMNTTLMREGRSCQTGVCHTFRGTGLTIYLTNGRRDVVSSDEVERIVI